VYSKDPAPGPRFWASWIQTTLFI